MHKRQLEVEERGRLWRKTWSNSGSATYCASLSKVPEFQISFLKKERTPMT